jgi:hypothetical protein
MASAPISPFLGPNPLIPLTTPPNPPINLLLNVPRVIIPSKLVLLGDSSSKLCWSQQLLRDLHQGPKGDEENMSANPNTTVEVAYTCVNGLALDVVSHQDSRDSRYKLIIPLAAAAIKFLQLSKQGFDYRNGTNRADLQKPYSGLYEEMDPRFECFKPHSLFHLIARSSDSLGRLIRWRMLQCKSW